MRALLIAALSVFVALGFHTWAGGVTPPLTALGIAFACCAFGAVHLAGRWLSWTHLALAAALNQIVMHFTFEWGAAITPVSQVADEAMAGAHQHHLELTIGAATHHHTHDAMHMVFAHIGAALLTIAMLRLGEVAVNSAVSWWSHTLRRWINRKATLPADVRRLNFVFPAANYSNRRLRHVLERRGPPAKLYPV